jgi:hypothetical protein
MQKAEIDALVLAHQGRTQPVAFFHVLRQPTLGPDDHAFLSEHIDELGISDLVRWRMRCEPGYTGAVIQQLARLAIEKPDYFKHEVLGLPRFELMEDEWIELASRIQGKVPVSIYERVLERGRRDPARRVSDFMFTPGVIKSMDPLLDDEDAPEPGLPAEPDETRHRSMPQIIAARESGALRMADEALLNLAMDRAIHGAEDWSRGVRELPPLLKPAILVKARRTPRGAERVNLLTWLDAHDAPRATLVEIVIEGIRAGTISHPEILWLSRKLVTRTAWDKHGLSALSALLAARAFGEMSELIALAWGEGARERGEVPKGLLEAIQAAFAATLIGVTREALEAGDERRALSTLSALVCLDPPSRVSRLVHDLRRFQDAGPEVRELIGVSERLVKHSDARDASLEGVVAALHAIADSMG